MSKISLAASMRSNLLSLQNISRQVSSAQNNLATGNKVNSAIDNPSSYYTASALSHRADDLNALLDSMGQAVSTIKAATTALDVGADFLEQMAAVATQSLDRAVPAKAWFEQKGTVVSSAQELKDAVASGKKNIIVYGKIDYFENEKIQLQAGQKLVGTEYYTGHSGKAKFSELNFRMIKVEQIDSAINAASNATVSDLAINYKSASVHGNWGAIFLESAQNVNLSNLDIDVPSTDTTNNVRAAIWVNNNSSVFIGGEMNIAASGAALSGIINNYSTVNVLSDATFNLNIVPLSTSFGIYNIRGGVFNLYAGGVINNYSGTHTIRNYENSTANIWGTINGSGGSIIGSIFQNNITNIYASAQINSYNTQDWFFNINSTLNIAKGSVFTYAAAGGSKAFQVTADYSGMISNGVLTGSNISTYVSNDILSDFAKAPFPKFSKPAKDEQDKHRYNNVLDQYNKLVNDSSYKGVALLKNDSLNVKFNEKGTASLVVVGKDMSSDALGLNVAGWQTQDDIAQSLAEISAALKNIRSYSAELGNNYSIISNRRDFTENLINILTEGADKLTLADMNEESASILAMQTRQQLAINSLSLASQASQAVLKLF